MTTSTARWVPALLLGLAGGAGGALALRALAPEAAGPPSAPAASSVEVRLERIEQALRRLEGRESAAQALGPPGPGLEGRAPVAAPPAAGAAALLSGPEGQALRLALREELGSVLDARAAAQRDAASTGPAAAARPAAKKRVLLSEAARDLALTGDEEASLRRIYADRVEKMIRLLAKDEAEAVALRGELRDAQSDPKKGRALMTRMMPRVLTHLGEVAALGLEQQEAVSGLLGAERAARLESEYDVVEGNPLGAGGELRVEARSSDR